MAACVAVLPHAQEVGSPGRAPASCFLLYQLGAGEVRRAPSAACLTRVTPASTFKIPHALAALDAGVFDGPDAQLSYDGSPQLFASWKRDHTLRSAIRDSVVWFFQRTAERLGPEREREYLRKFAYGNADPTSGLTSFWLGGSLLISPAEQERFLVALYSNALPVSRVAMSAVLEMLVQPTGSVVNAAGTHPFGGRWPDDTVLAAKRGSARDGSGHEVRWLVGHVLRARGSWVFVSCVIGGAGLAPFAAVELAAQSLTEEGVL